MQSNLPRSFCRPARVGPGRVVATMQGKSFGVTRRQPVAKKSKPTLHVSLAGLRDRVERASREGRHHQALELAHSLYRQEASEQHRELLKKTTLGRARQLRTEGKSRDAFQT